MKILLIVQPERFDFYSYLALAEGVEWALLWYEKPGQMVLPPEALPIKFKRICYWNEFRTPMELLKELNPDRIIFFEIIDLRQIALNVVANNFQIPTFYLEHGAAGDKDTAIERWKEITFTGQRLTHLLKRLQNSFFDILRSKYFYYSVPTKFLTKDSWSKYLLLPFKLLKDSPNKVLSFNIFRERVPLKSIVFNQVNFEEYALYTGIKPDDALFTGLPFFDKYFRNTIQSKEHVVFIDSPYFEDNICGWTDDHHKSVAKALFLFAEQTQIQLFIKLHPRSNANLWKTYTFNKRYVTIIQEGDYSNLYLEAKLILGFSSSLMSAFLCAKKNIVFLAWHPDRKIFGADFSKTGLCHLSYSVNDLFEKYEYWINHNLALDNKEAYNQFLHQFNFPFDGKATERVIEAIKNP